MKHSPEKVKEWLIRLKGSEGGYVNRNPKDDPGGETKWGITKRSYPNLDIKNLTVESAATIYIRDFLRPLKIERFEDGVVFQLFDFAVHSGIHGAVVQIQKGMGLVPDGVIGQKTVAAIDHAGEARAIMMILAIRLEFLTGLDNWHANSRGWARRIAKNLWYGVTDL